LSNGGLAQFIDRKSGIPAIGEVTNVNAGSLASVVSCWDGGVCPVQLARPERLDAALVDEQELELDAIGYGSPASK
jgi:hypothetical protein